MLLPTMYTPPKTWQGSFTASRLPSSRPPSLLTKLPEFIKGLASELVGGVTGTRRVQRHSAVLAACFGVVPGLGQVYNGEMKRAALFLALEGAMLGGALYYAAETDDAQEHYDAGGHGADFEFLYSDIERNRAINRAFLGAAAGVICWSVADSFVTGRRIGAAMNVSSVGDEVRIAWVIGF